MIPLPLIVTLTLALAPTCSVSAALLISSHSDNRILHSPVSRGSSERGAQTLVSDRGARTLVSERGARTLVSEGSARYRVQGSQAGR